MTGTRRAYVFVGPDGEIHQSFVPLYQHSNYGMNSLLLLREWEVEAVAREVWHKGDTTLPELIYISANKAGFIPKDGMPVLDLWGGISRLPTKLPEEMPLPGNQK